MKQDHDKRDYDILIMGAGMVGTSLALALSHLPLRIAIIEKTSFNLDITPNLDSKPIALNYASSRILKNLIPWTDLSAYANPIEQVHISEAGCFAAARIKAKAMGVSALGYVIPASLLGCAFTKALIPLTEGSKPLRLDLFNPAQCQALLKNEQVWEAHITTETGELQTISARLVVAADGSDSIVRQLLGIKVQAQSKGQMALVTTLKLARHHHHTAYQRFTSQGVMAALPLLGNQVGFVCTAPQHQIEERQSLSKSEFLAWVQSLFAYRLGQFLESGSLRSYPIKSFIAEPQAQAGLILLGNAAHTLSPIAAQGLNLALQDMAELADRIAKAFVAQKDLADSSISQAYLAARLPAQKQLIGLTENLGRLFQEKFRPLTLIRNSGLLAFDLVSPLKQNISRRLMGTHGRLSPLVRGIAPQQEEEHVKI
ncbi:2-polyprenyl-6-methoxyphenol 4-hydroxylase [Candidatus Rickettsiella viridis]|uniref:2-polyprenyl-6-methoxyphenol 4-hydroxylase n=1 Tax=Candidatus Rickettsiella viridis TaxID=676208 RepID=A0A2Z5UTY0_9COXI|nr:FAD-dependent monooxygenase [Candidatus Rickettsiella viridis]BBB14969.1 2-polyprenyl-6-methoxyphenol 4-hydroxylase [Candidatus Rickettsiella viridis]